MNFISIPPFLSLVFDTLSYPEVEPLGMIELPPKTVANDPQNIELATRDVQVKEMDPLRLETARVSTIDGVQKYDENDDEAMKAMAGFGGEPLVVEEETNERLLRIIDWHLMPLL
jgi:hypothetical protein